MNTLSKSYLCLSLCFCLPLALNAAADGTVLTPLNEANQPSKTVEEPTSVPRFACTFNRFCMIELLRGEKLIADPIITDNVNWELIILEGPSGQTFVVLQPKEHAKIADIFLITNIKAYLLELVPTKELFSPVFTVNTPLSSRLPTTEVQE